MQHNQYLKRLDADMRLWGLSGHTRDSYWIHVTKFLEFTNRAVEELDETDVREFLMYLIRENNVKTVTVNSYSASIRFFFAVTLNRTMNYLQIPRFKTPKKLPEILMREETHRLINECPNVKHKALFQIVYGSGLRISEIAALRVKDIDSKAMYPAPGCVLLSDREPIARDLPDFKGGVEYEKASQAVVPGSPQGDVSGRFRHDVRGRPRRQSLRAAHLALRAGNARMHEKAADGLAGKVPEQKGTG